MPHRSARARIVRRSAAGARAGAVAAVLACAALSSGQLPSGDFLALRLVDPAAPVAPPATRRPFEIHVEGAAGLWVAVVAHASIVPTAATTLDPAALAAFHAAWPWAAPPAPTVLAAVPILIGNQRTVGVPFPTLVAAVLGLWPAGTAERSRAQPILAPAAGVLPGTAGVPRIWDTACPSWTANPETAAGSVQRFWADALYAASSAPNQTATNTTLFDPLKLGDLLLSSQAGGPAAYDDFLDTQAAFMLANALEVRVTLQACGFTSVPHFLPATTEGGTGGFEPADPGTQAIFAALSGVSAVGYSIGTPVTGIHHPGFTLNGVPLQPLAYPTRVDIPCRGAMHPGATLTLAVPGGTRILAGEYLAAGWMRFRTSWNHVLPLSGTVTVLGIQNAAGPMSGFLPGSPEPITWGPLPVNVP